jgi:hypothetical protein
MSRFAERGESDLLISKIKAMYIAFITLERNIRLGRFQAYKGSAAKSL